MSQTLSVIIPAYNEASHIYRMLERLVSVTFPDGFLLQLLLVDDGSQDETTAEARRFKENHSDLDFILLRHEENRGKGAAIRTALAHVTGEYTVIQDADEEYYPQDLALMVGEIEQKGLTVLYGSRYLGGGRRKRSIYPSFYYGVRLLSITTNLLYGQHITDEATCYKMFRTDFLRSLPLRSQRFEFCPEVTALTARRGIRIPEIPIHYTPRSIGQGKKIRPADGFEAFLTLIRLRFKKLPEK